MLFLRIKQVETALKDGRLDEAYELLAESDAREHRRGQELTGQLVQALLDRGRCHLENDQPEQALCDATTQLPLEYLEPLLRQAKALYDMIQEFPELNVR